MGLAALTLAGLVLSGCGPGGSPLHAVVAASTKTLTQTASVSTTVRGAAAFGASSRVVVQEAFAFPRGLGYEAVSVSEGSRPPHTIYLDYFPTSVDLEFLAGLTLPAGKHWISGSFLGTPPWQFPRFVEQLEGLNPALLLDELVWGATSATSRGQDVINHVPYAEYTVTLDLRRALAGARRAGNKAMSAAITGEIGATAAARPDHGQVAQRMTVWVDGPGRIAQVRGALPGSGLGTLTTMLSNFGVAIPMNPPPSSETIAIQRAAQLMTSHWVFGG